ncbi:MAG: TonB-dependent receptor, partial [Cyclobacteriaceae bacterium]|nr:TonB-dependent receptor [Cyclobacteriaceae bacterium]
MKHIIYTLFLWGTLFTLEAQQRPANSQRAGASPFKVSGQVIDEDSGEPLEYVSAVLLNAKDSSVVSGAVTDIQGKFVISSRPGRFILQIQYISYHDKFINNIQLNRENATRNVGTLKLAADVDVLDEVVVQGEKTSMVLSLDKRVFNVGKDLSNMGGTAADLLDNIPSVSVDVEGNISLRGSENVRVLVDGKPSGLVGISSSDALRQLQGNMVERVEVVTNPSARYDAEGLAGIINIILKKENREGVNGSFNVVVGHPDNYGISFNLNYRRKWVNLFANYGVSYRQ